MITSLLKHPCSPSPPQLVLWLKAQEKAGEATNSGQSAIVGFSGEDEMLLWLDVLSIKVGKDDPAAAYVPVLGEVMTVRSLLRPC